MDTLYQAPNFSYQQGMKDELVYFRISVRIVRMLRVVKLFETEKRRVGRRNPSSTNVKGYC